MQRLLIVFSVVGAVVSSCGRVPENYTNELGIEFARITPGTFVMGSDTEGDFDERPVREVRISHPFLMSITEITNAQYEAFDPGHRKERGKYGNSIGDDEAVVMVSWEEATSFCQWLSDMEGKYYRLPTEAEWEYACRSGMETAYHRGDSLDAADLKEQEEFWHFPKVDLAVAQSAPNYWKLYDMHGNVEEWCEDWYGPYPDAAVTDPVGVDTGLFKVTRGGSFGTEPYYLRSANRSGALPGQRHPLIGIRLVIAEPMSGIPHASEKKQKWAMNVSQSNKVWGAVGGSPFFKDPVPFVLIPEGDDDALFDIHNHCPALTVCPNGDLLAIWYSTKRERGRELSIAGSRLRNGSGQWDVADVFWDAPDRNDHASDLLWDQKTGLLYHYNGMSSDATWGKLTMFMRKSSDNGASWSLPEMIGPVFGLRNMPVAGSIITHDDRVLLPCDAVTAGHGGTVLWEGTLGGSSWRLLSDSTWKPEYAEGACGAWIAGIHAGIVQLKDNRLLAFGRGNSINGRMPMSISDDGGSRWQYHASPFPPISGGQRLALIRLMEGPILFISFTSDHDMKDLMIEDEQGKMAYQHGMYAALSYDEGAHWPVKKLLSNTVEPKNYNGGAWTRDFVMSKLNGEPKGYLVARQAPDGTIHLLSSALHYQFNLSWLEN